MAKIAHARPLSIGAQAAAFYEQSLLGRFGNSRTGLPSPLRLGSHRRFGGGLLPLDGQSNSPKVNIQHSRRLHSLLLPKGLKCSPIPSGSFHTSPKVAFRTGISRRSWSLNVSPRQTAGNLLIGPEPILKEKSTPRSDSSSWTPDDEWEDVMQPPQGRLLLVDAMAVAYRAHFKVGAKLVWDEAQHTSQQFPLAEESLTVLTFVSNLVTLLELLPTHVGIVFDAGGKNFRHEMFPQYKQHRSAMPETLSNALSYIHASVRGLGLTLLQRPGVEADDVIASLATRGVSEGMKVRVASPDKDFFQLLGPNLRLLRPRPKGVGIDSFGVEEFEAKFNGLRVDQFADMQALMGDAADNIPGMFGIGPKTALKLLKEYDTLDNIIANRESVLPLRARTSLCAEYEKLPGYKRLVVLRTELDDLLMGHVGALDFSSPKDTMAAANLIDALASNVPNSKPDSLKRRIENVWQLLRLRSQAQIGR